MDIKDSYLHGTVGVVKSISVSADKLKYKLADIAGTVREVTLPVATTSANGLMSSADKSKLDAFNSGSLKNDLVLKINSGTTEGTSLYTYNGSAAKTLDIKSGTGIGFTNNAGSLQIYNSGVRSVATGTTNGTISVNTGGAVGDVAVKGLGSAAYTASTDYYNLKTYVSPTSDSWYYKKITVTKNTTYGYGIWLHSRQQHFLANSGLALGTSYMLKLYELGTNINGTDTSRSMSVKMVATYSSSDVTFYVKINGHNYLQVVSSGTITILDSTQSEYDGITPSTEGWIPCTYAKWTDTTYTFTSGTAGNFTVTPLGGTAQTVSIGKPATASTADAADKLKTKRKLWGLDFDGSADVSGNMTGVGIVNSIFEVNKGSGNAKLNVTSISSDRDYLSLYVSSNTSTNTTTRPLVVQHGYGNVGIGVIAPSEKLEVNGNVKATSFIGNLDGTYVNKLTGYSKATSIAALATTDTLNTALGKLEYKADVAYDLVKGAYDGDGTIENLAEILKVLEGIKDTETIKAIIGKYLPLTGGKLNSGTDTPLVILGTDHSWIGFKNSSGTNLGWIGVLNSKLPSFYSDRSYKMWHEGNDGAGSGLAADVLEGTLIANKSTNTCYSNLNLKWYNNINNVSGYAGDNTGFPVSNNANGLLWLGVHNNYGGQLGISSDSRLYYRFVNYGSFPTSTNGASWKKLAFTSDLPSFIGGRRYVLSKSATMNTTLLTWYLKIELLAYAKPSHIVIKGHYNNCMDEIIIDPAGFNLGYIYRNNNQNSGNVTDVWFENVRNATTNKWTFWLKLTAIQDSTTSHYSPSSSATYTVYLSDNTWGLDVTATTTAPSNPDWVYVQGTNLVIKNANLWGNASTSTKLLSKTIVNAKSFSLSNASWTDTGYTFASLTSGTYVVQVTSGSNLVASGIMSVYKNLSDTAGDEIPLHVYGTAGWRPYLRTYANKLLISSNDASATSRTVTIKIALIL